MTIFLFLWVFKWPAFSVWQMEVFPLVWIDHLIILFFTLALSASYRGGGKSPLETSRKLLVVEKWLFTCLGKVMLIWLLVIVKYLFLPQALRL